MCLAGDVAHSAELLFLLRERGTTSFRSDDFFFFCNLKIYRSSFKYLLENFFFSFQFDFFQSSRLFYFYPRFRSLRDIVERVKPFDRPFHVVSKVKRYSRSFAAYPPMFGLKYSRPIKIPSEIPPRRIRFPRFLSPEKPRLLYLVRKSVALVWTLVKMDGVRVKISLSLSLATAPNE